MPPAWLGLEEAGEGHWTFELTSPLCRGDGSLYGGTGIAVAVALQEAVTGRDALWSTVQFVGSAKLGERLDCDVAVVASGRRNAQMGITVRAGGRTVLSALGSAGVPTDAPVEVQVPTMPVVPGPEEGADWQGRRQGDAARNGWVELADMRRIELPNRGLAMWGRLRDQPMSRAGLAFMADFVPVSVSRASGQMGAGISLDNSMRFGRLVETEWVLYDFDPWLATGGYLHGGARVWAQDGTLLGYASQTATALTR